MLTDRLGKILSVSLVSVLTFSSSAQATWFADVDAGLVYNDNVGRSEKGRDIEGDTSVELFASGGKFFDLGDGKSITLTGHAEAAGFFDYTELNHLSVGVSASFRNKFGLGANAPWMGISAGVAHDAFNDGDRSGWTYDIGLQAGKRISERWDLTGSISYENHNATNADPAGPWLGPLPWTLPTDVFDTEAFSLSLLGDYTFSESTLISVGYTYRNGDVTSIATPDLEVINAADAVATDHVFGGGRAVYRLDAETHSIKFELNHALSDSSSFVLGYEYQKTYGNDDIDYDNNIFRANLLYSF